MIKKPKKPSKYSVKTPKKSHKRMARKNSTDNVDWFLDNNINNPISIPNYD